MWENIRVMKENTWCPTLFYKSDRLIPLHLASLFYMWMKIMMLLSIILIKYLLIDNTWYPVCKISFKRGTGTPVGLRIFGIDGVNAVMTIQILWKCASSSFETFRQCPFISDKWIKEPHNNTEENVLFYKRKQCIC